MMRDLQKIQELINDENWVELRNHDVLGMFNFQSTDWKNISFSKSFILDVILNNTVWDTMFAFSKAKISSMLFNDDILKNLSERIRQLNLSMSPSDWSKWITVITGRVSAGLYNNTDAYNAFGYETKDTNFFRAMIDDTVYKTISKAEFNSNGTSTINTEVFAELGKEEKLALGARLTFGGLLRPRAARQHLFADFFESVNDIVNFCVASSDMTVGQVLSGLSTQDFEKIMTNQIKTTYITEYNISSKWLTYYDVNDKAQISDEMVDLLYTSTNMAIFGKIVNALSDEQFENNKYNMSTFTKVQRKGLPLSSVNNGETFDVSEARFFTEEEIIANPNLFDPTELRHSPSMYISKKTFSLMNKAWDTRKRWNSDLVKFKSIINGISYTNKLDITALKYLVKKTGVSEKEVIDVLDGAYFGSNETSDKLTMKAFVKFFKKYNQD